MYYFKIENNFVYYVFFSKWCRSCSCATCSITAVQTYVHKVAVYNDPRFHLSEDSGSSPCMFRKYLWNWQLQRSGRPCRKAQDHQVPHNMLDILSSLNGAMSVHSRTWSVLLACWTAFKGKIILSDVYLQEMTKRKLSCAVSPEKSVEWGCPVLLNYA